MLTLNDGRNELWQWDTGRNLTVDADCSQVHFSNKVFGRSIDVDVVDGVADIPDILLQTDRDLIAWAFVGTAENGYTKISKVFKVNKRNKPADYVFTPPEQTTLEEIKEKIEYLESIQDPDAIKNAVDDALEQAKASGEFDGKDYVLTEADKAEIADMAAGLVELPDSGGNVDQGATLSDAEKNAMLTLFKSAMYTTDVSGAVAVLETLWGGSGGNGGNGDSGEGEDSGGDNPGGGDDTGGGGTETITYTVTNNLTKVTTSNSATSVTSGSAYGATLTADNGYELEVTVTMGGVNVTASAYSNGKIVISNVTGDIVITASASTGQTHNGFEVITYNAWGGGSIQNLTLYDGAVGNDGNVGYTGSTFRHTGYILCEPGTYTLAGASPTLKGRYYSVSDFSNKGELNTGDNTFTESVYVIVNCSLPNYVTFTKKNAAALTGISATYTGGDVTVGTAVTSLSGVTVTASYSDGSTANVSGYTLSGTIAEGENTITVTYENMTATFTVTGVTESGGSGGGETYNGFEVITYASFGGGSVENLAQYDGAIKKGTGVPDYFGGSFSHTGYILLEPGTYTIWVSPTLTLIGAVYNTNFSYKSYIESKSLTVTESVYVIINSDIRSQSEGWSTLTKEG